MTWENYLQALARRERCTASLSALELIDAAWEDPQGRPPIDPQHGTGAVVLRLPELASDDELRSAVSG